MRTEIDIQADIDAVNSKLHYVDIDVEFYEDKLGVAKGLMSQGEAKLMILQAELIELNQAGIDEKKWRVPTIKDDAGLAQCRTKTNKEDEWDEFIGEYICNSPRGYMVRVASGSVNGKPVNFNYCQILDEPANETGVSPRDIFIEAFGEDSLKHFDKKTDQIIIEPTLEDHDENCNSLTIMLTCMPPKPAACNCSLSKAETETLELQKWRKATDDDVGRSLTCRVRNEDTHTWLYGRTLINFYSSTKRYLVSSCDGIHETEKHFNFCQVSDNAKDTIAPTLQQKIQAQFPGKRVEMLERNATGFVYEDVLGNLFDSNLTCQHELEMPLAVLFEGGE